MQELAILAHLPPVASIPEISKSDYGIGLVGLGNVANWAHMPAYRKYGFNVVAVADTRAEARERAQSHWGVPKVYERYEELLEDRAVDIVDLTLHHTTPRQVLKEGGSGYARLDVLRDAVAAGKKGLLVDKPMADTYERAKAMVEATRGSKTRFAVNQNGRWGPAHYVARQVIQSGHIGEVDSIMIDCTFPMRFSDIVVQMTVHHFDLIRWWVGLDRQVDRIYCSFRQPEQTYSTILAQLDFADGARASVWDNGAGEEDLRQSPTSDQWHRFRIEGSQGTIKGTHQWNLMMAKDEVEVLAWREKTWQRPVLTAQFPDAGFRGSMAELMQSITEDRPPLNSGEDNLKTLQLVFGALRSAAERRAVDPSELA
jgi:predicted dehydrogenase